MRLTRLSAITELIRRCLPAGPLARSVAILAGGNALAQLIGIAVYPILTRLYTPSDFGLVGVYSSLLSLMLILTTARYELAIPLPKRDRSGLDVVVLTLICAFSISIFLAVVLALFGGIFLEVTNSIGLRSYLWLLPIAVFCSGIYQAFCYWATRRKFFRLIAQTRLNQSISNAVTGVGIGVFHSGPLGLLLGLLISQTAGIFTLFKDVWHVAKRIQFQFSWRRVLHIAYVYRQFPLFSSIAGVLNTSGSILPVLLLASFYGSEVTGWFSLAQRLISLPMGLVGQAVLQVFLGEAAQLLNTNPGQLPAFFSRVTKRLLPFCLLVAILACLSPFVFGFIFGEKFARAGMYAAILGISGSIQVVVSPISIVGVVVKRQDIQLVLDIVRVVVIVIAMYVPAFWNAPALVTVSAYVFVMTLLYIVSFFVYQSMVIKCAAKS